MRRIRVALTLLSLGLLVPMGLLAWRALDGIALERVVRHQALADRAFDEMERALSRFLAREEARPFEAYRFYISGPGDRSPLSTRDGLEDFVVGAFQQDAEGRVTTPMAPADPAAARARADRPLRPHVQAAIAEVEAAVARSHLADLGKRDDREARLDLGDARRLDPAAPGRTRPEESPPALAKERAAASKDEASAESDSVYDVLQRFNRAAEDRAERKQKVATAKLPRAQSSPAPSLAYEEGIASSAELPRAAGEAPVSPSVAPSPLRALGYVVSEPEILAEAGMAPAEAQAALPFDDADAVRLSLDPMVGRPAGDAHLLLYRTVLVGDQGFRQGLVLDRARLLRWLEQESLGASGLSRVASLGLDPGARPRDFAFNHRFAEPFDALSARLELSSLPGLASPGAIYGLVALVLLVGAGGIFAIHRMVSVVVEFAERRGNFVAAVTHELKTPLTAIRMYGEMLRDGLVPSEEKRAEYFSTISDESERLSRLIDNVLEFSRLEHGRREMRCSVGPVGPVLEEAVQKLRAHAEREGFALEVAVEPDLPSVRFDRDALLQVLFNLVDNAMKYASAAKRRCVVLEARRRDGGVELSVRDFGPGVSGRQLSRIFEPFYRGEDELTRSAKGTGIGLALVKDLAERMGAAVAGANADGGGFRVSLAFEVAEGSGA